MNVEEFLEQQKNCSKDCGTVDIEHCCRCAFAMAEQPEWKEGDMPKDNPVIARVVTPDGRYAYQTYTDSDNGPDEPVKGWWKIPRLG